MSSFSRRSHRLSCRGFTYVESGAVIIVLTLLAMLAMPNVFAMQNSRSLRLFKTQVQALAKDAKSRAMESGDKVLLVFDKATNSIQSVDESSNGTRTKIKQAELPEGTSTVKFTADQADSPTDTWEVPFYPDGTSAGGGVEFKSGEESFSLAIQRVDSSASVEDGPVPDLADDSWPAGGYAPRS
jgi:type II secretory pathway pseudopilin PulG